MKKLKQIFSKNTLILFLISIGSFITGYSIAFIVDQLNIL